MDHSHDISHEEGQTLILVLAFLAAFGFLIVVLLGGVEVNLKTTSVVRSRTERVYAADAGIEYGVKRLAIDPTLCASATPSSLPSQTTNGRTADITCRVSAGSDETLGGAGWAAIITGNLTTQAGGTGTISGPTYVSGSISGSGFKDKDGSVSQHFANCPGGHVAPPGVDVSPTPPYSWLCTTAPTPDPPHVLPPVPTVLNPVSQDFGSCRVFFPGKYTTKPVMSSQNYFVSGVYYFEDIGVLSTNGDVVGGYNPSDPSTVTLPSCPNPATTDATAGGGGSGLGVEWIFGGTSSISVGNKDNLELHARVPGPAEPATVTPRITFAAVSPSMATGGYQAEAGTSVFDSSGGHPGMSIFGLFYAPTADVGLDGPNGITVMHGGIVVHNLSIKLSFNGATDDPIIGVESSASNKRFAVLTATAASSGEKSIVSQALVEIRNNTNPATIAVHSWRTG